MNKNLIATALIPFLLTLTACGGGGGSSEPDTPAPQPPQAFNDYSVTVIDGYLKNADVWLDINGNGEFDTDEPSATTGDGGKSILQVPSDLTATDYAVIVLAKAGITIDESHGQPIVSDFVMAAPSGESVITPLTTLVYVEMEAGATQEQAVQQVSVSLNIPESEVLGDFIAEESVAAEIAAANVVSSKVIPADTTKLLEAVVNPTELTYEVEKLAEAIDKLEDGELIVPDENGELVVSPDSDGDGLADVIDPPPVVVEPPVTTTPEESISLSLNGESVITLEVHNQYDELGAVGESNINGVLSVQMSGTVDVSTVGTYVVTYSVTDSTENVTTTTREITVVDTAKPSLTLIGDSAVTVGFKSLYEEQGATVSDNYDEDIVVVIDGDVDAYTLGDYNITYSAEDSSGNSTIITRVVSVSDIDAPALNIEYNNISIMVGGNILLPSVTAIDDVDGDISDAVVMSALPDTSVAGEYEITFSSTDSSLNVSEQTLVIIIIEPDYQFTFKDSDLRLMEGDYSHRFYFVMNDTQNFERNMSVTISDASTSTEGDDFSISVNSFTLDANVVDGFIEIEVIDDSIYEGDEEIVLTFTNDDNEQSFDYTIHIDDRTVAPIVEEDMHLTPFSPNAEIIDDELIVLSKTSIEKRTLTMFSDTVYSSSSSIINGVRSSEAIGEGFSYIERSFSSYYDEYYSDSFIYNREIYVISGNQLLHFDRELNAYTLFSQSPYIMSWSSQVTVIGTKAYFIGSLGSVKAQTYDFVSGNWSVLADFPRNSETITAAVDNVLYAFKSTSGYKYDSIADTWVALTTPPYINGSFLKAYTLDKKVYIPTYGSSGLTNTTNIVVYDTVLDSWSSIDVDVAQRNYKDLVTYKGFTYLIGGRDSSGDTSHIAKYYIGTDL